MDIKNIYEHIDINDLAEYQIKVKGDVKTLRPFLKKYCSTCTITVETTDTDYHICMITVARANQRYLFTLVNILLRNDYPVISVFCSDIPKKAESDIMNTNEKPARSA